MEQKHKIIVSETVAGITTAEKECLDALDGFEVAFKRYFLSDAGDSDGLARDEGAVSLIVQPPLDGSRIAVWLWLVKGADVTRKGNVTIADDCGVKHIWMSGMQAPGACSGEQTSRIFEEYESLLSAMGLSFADNCVRTWIHVADIDSNYAGVVKARRENFSAIGLVPNTHYIASTGIQGFPCKDGALVQMDAYAVSGVFAQNYLYAPTHLNPTYEYGVTFERGVTLSYGDSRTTLISGTASIDNKGAVVHVGDVRLQTLRMWENVEKLLEEADCGWDDVKQILVYLRNPEDFAVVSPMFEEKFSGTPYVILEAPVCRPDWLIEMECIA